MVERFVYKTGTISVASNASTVTGTGTAWGGRDRAGSQILALPNGVAPVVVGIVAEAEPRGDYDDLSLPLVSPYKGAALTGVSYVILDGPAIANGATQAALYARFAAQLEQSMGLAGNNADDIDYSLVPNNTIIVDDETRTLRQWRNGVMEDIAAGVINKRGKVVAATTADIDIATALNNGDTVDGVTLATGDAVLVWKQTNKVWNGVFIVGTTPARAPDFFTFDSHAGSLIAVGGGTANGGWLFYCSANEGGTLGTTSIEYSKIAAVNGNDGDPGTPATIEIGTVTTGEPGTDVIIQNVGTASELVLNITIPAGDLGPANTLTIGTVEPGDEAAAEITGDAPDQTLNLTLPKGDTGDAATIEIGTVETGEPGSNVIVENVGTSGAAVFNITIPAGDTGPANTLTIGVVEGGLEADAEITGTAPDQILNLTLPEGDQGDAGWSPVFAVVADDDRRVLQVSDWVGGEGTKPATGKYVGATGLETDIGDGVDIRGAAGAGNGDMEKSVYDPDDNGKFANAQLEDMSEGTVKMRRAGAGSGAPTDTTLANLKTDLALNNVTNDAQIPLSYLDTDSTLAANSDTKIATQKALKTYADALIAANDAMVFKGVVDCSTNPNYPAADRGWTYRVSVAGKIGGASGAVVQAGDLTICLDDATSSGNQASVGTNWTVVQTNIDGALISTDIGVTVQGYDADLAAIAALVDPNADRLLFWDDSAGTYTYLTLNAGLEISNTTIRVIESHGIALSDETTAITTGTNKATMSLPYAFTVTSVYATLNTASSSGIPTVDINEAGTTILSTKLTIDASEKTSATAATAAVISDASIAANAEIGFDIDVAGTGAKGLKVFIQGYRT